MRGEGIEDVVNLIRCAWAGSQRYGVVLWSGDIHSNFETLRMQVAAGLNVGLSGIPWWTTDIGGFFGGDPRTDYFRELIVRWFQFGVFCPVFRLHGWRLPRGPKPAEKDTGMFDFNTSGPNEVWEFGDRACAIISRLMFLRERLKPYIMAQMRAASETGAPPMRPLFFDFPADAGCWEIEDQFMFGPDILVAPVLYEGMEKRRVYLPDGVQWTDVKSGQPRQGGTRIEVEAPLDTVPVFARNGAEKYFSES
jgi:alpha-D-xyloside xylohydrolase